MARVAGGTGEEPPLLGAPLTGALAEGELAAAAAHAVGEKTGAQEDDAAAVVSTTNDLVAKEGLCSSEGDSAAAVTTTDVACCCCWPDGEMGGFCCLSSASVPSPPLLSDGGWRFAPMSIDPTCSPIMPGIISNGAGRGRMRLAIPLDPSLDWAWVCNSTSAGSKLRTLSPGVFEGEE